MSSFYPEDFESTKITNNVSRQVVNDWFLFLSPCVSPAMDPTRWLMDYVWSKYVYN